MHLHLQVITAWRKYTDHVHALRKAACAMAAVGLRWRQRQGLAAFQLMAKVMAGQRTQQLRLLVQTRAVLGCVHLTRSAMHMLACSNWLCGGVVTPGQKAWVAASAATLIFMGALLTRRLCIHLHVERYTLPVHLTLKPQDNLATTCCPPPSPREHQPGML